MVDQKEREVELEERELKNLHLRKRRYERVLFLWDLYRVLQVAIELDNLANLKSLFYFLTDYKCTDN